MEQPAALPAPSTLVFISHSSHDRAIAEKVVEALEVAGVPCWIASRDISEGTEYNAAIMAAIIASTAMVLIYTRSSVDSDPVIREVERALGHKIAVIPVRFDQTPPTKAIEYLISTSQWVDAFPPPVERHLPKIVGGVKRALKIAHETPRPDPNAPPEYVGPYRILELLGEGGMGAVYKAEQRTPVKRIVALKVIRAGLSTKEVLARFESERQALTMMNHPNIAGVLDASADQAGNPYFTMEYVPGVPITRFSDENKLNIRDRLLLFQQVCGAISHAHTKTLIHRDVKANNVLAFMDGEKPTVKVIDFGIAKSLKREKLTDRTLNTERGLAIGTYESMSPEQAIGSSDIDTLTDVYSLGVLLYEMLSGAMPFDEKTFRQAADEEMRRIIREVEPPRPSTRLSSLGDTATQIAAARQSELEALSNQLRRELDWIPLMAMRKERDRRYASSAALAADIQNYLDGVPLIAAPDSVGYRVRKLVRRNKGIITVVAMVIAVLLLSITGTTLGLVGQSRERREAQRQEQIAVDQRIEAEHARAIAIAQTEKAERQGYFASISAANIALERNQPSLARTLLNDTPPRQRRWEWNYYQASLDKSLAVLRGHEEAVLSVAMSPDGAHLVTASRDRTARVWDTATGREIARLSGHTDSVLHVVISPDSSRVVTASADRTTRLWDAANWRELSVISAHEGTPLRPVFSADGARLAVASTDGVADVWDVARAEKIATFRADRLVFAMAFSSDGNKIATGTAGGVITILDVSSAEKRNLLGDKNAIVHAVAFSPDGKTLAACFSDGAACLWDAEGGRDIAVLRGHTRDINSITFSPDGKRVATASEDATTRLWDAHDGSMLAELRGHEGSILSAAFSPDGGRLVTTSVDKTSRIWDVRSGQNIAVLRGHEAAVFEGKFSTDGTRLVTASNDMTARLWDATLNQGNSILYQYSEYDRSIAADGPVPTPPDDASPTDHSPEGFRRESENKSAPIAFSNDGTLFASALDGNTGRIWNLSSAQALVDARGHAGTILSIAFSPDHSKLATASMDRTARIWDAKTGRELATLRGHERWISAVVFSPDGKQVATASGDGTARLWNAETARELFSLHGHTNDIRGLAFSPDGRRLATVSDDHTGRLWDVASGRDVAILAGHQGGIHSVAYSTDGTRLVTASNDGTARIWDASNGKSITPLRGHASRVLSAIFSRDDTMVATASVDNTARVWNATTGREICVLRGHEGEVLSAAFSPDGTRVATASEDKTARVWNPLDGRELAVLRGHLSRVGSILFSPDGARLATGSDDLTARIWDGVSAAERYKASGRPLIPNRSSTTQPTLSP